MTAVRFLISAIIVFFPILTLFVMFWKHQCSENKREGLKVVVTSLLAALLAGIWGGVIASSIEEYPTESIFNSTILQMDIPRVISAVTNFWSGAGAATNIHPFVPLLFQPLSFVFSLVTGIESKFRIAQLTSLFCLSVSASLLLLTTFSFTRRWSITIFVVLGYMASFGFLLLSSFPESSGLATFGTILPYAIYAIYRDKEFRTLEKTLYVFAGLLAFGVTVTNIIHALVVYLVRSRQSASKGSLQFVLISISSYLVLVLLVASGLSLIQNELLFPGGTHWFIPGGLVSQGAWLALWWDGWLHPFRVMVQVVLYAVAAPSLRLSDIGYQLEGMPLIQISAEASQLSEMSLRGIATLAVFSIFFIYTCFRALRIQFSQPILVGLLINLFFHMIYGNELLLYVGYWLPVIWVLIALGTNTSRHVWALLIVILLVSYNNYWGWMKMRTQLSNSSDYVMLQAPVGLPLQHEFRRTLVDWSGTFSPGIGSNGVLLVAYNLDERKSSLKSLAEQADVSHTFNDGCVVIRSHAGDLLVEQRWYPLKDGVLTSFALRIRQTATKPVRARVYMLLKSEGPAGSFINREYEWRGEKMVITADGVPFIWCTAPPSFILHHEKHYRLFEVAINGGNDYPRSLKNLLRSLKGENTPSRQNALLSWDITVQQGEEKKLWFYCTYSLPALNLQGNELHRVVNLPSYQATTTESAPLLERKVEELKTWSSQFWLNIRKDYHVSVPGPEWESGFWGATAYLVQSVQQDGRIPVTPINYGVFIRDAAYMIYALLVAGQYDYAKQAIDYLLRNPWEGRPYPEGDTPGHLLWVMHKYWLFTRDEAWLRQNLPTIRNVAQAILQMRSDGKRDVEVSLLDQRRTIPAQPGIAQRLQDQAGKTTPFQLNYGTMDQGGILYVNLVSLAGLQSAINMIGVFAPEDAAVIRKAFLDYRQEFNELLEAIQYDLSHDQRGYCFAMWPAQIHSVVPKVREYFARTPFDAQLPLSPWKYLDMDHAHNFLIAGERSAGYGVIQRYIELYTFKTWKLLDEGGPSSPGYWKELSNWRWSSDIAIPHGWSLASLVLLMRDAMVYEDSETLILLAGVPPHWFAAGVRLSYLLPTEYGTVKVQMDCEREHIVLNVDISEAPPKGIYAVVADSTGDRRVRLKRGTNVIPIAR